MTKQGGIKDIAQGRSDIYRIDPTIIQKKPGWNCRDTDTEEYRAGIAELAISVAAVGVKEAMTVVWEDGQPILTNGHRRLDAVLLAISNGADIKTVPVQTESRFADEAERVLSMLVRNSGVPFTPFENAAVYKRLVDLGWSLAQIADKTGVTDTCVRQTLDLLTMPEEVKAHVKAGSIAPATAAKVVKKVGKDKADAVIKKGVEKAKEKGRKKTTSKDMIEDLVGDVPKRRVIGSARTAPLDEAVALYDSLLAEMTAPALSDLSERLKGVLADAEWGDDTFVEVRIPTAFYLKLCTATGATPIEREE